MMNYKIEAIEILLSEDSLLERYHLLIPFKNELLKRFKKENIFTKEDAFNSDSILLDIFKDEHLMNLFKRFLNMYEVNKTKLKEIDKLNISIEERESYKELYLLPGVKATRARLYYLSSLKTLEEIAKKSYEEIISLTNKSIVDNKLDYKAPLPKEAKTHIAVAKLLTMYLIK